MIVYLSYPLISDWFKLSQDHREDIDHDVCPGFTSMLTTKRIFNIYEIVHIHLDPE